MNCPTCGVEMQPGDFVADYPKSYIMIGSVGYANLGLYFEPERRAPKQKRRLRVLRRRKPRPGYLCPECGASVIAGPDSKPGR